MVPSMIKIRLGFGSLGVWFLKSGFHFQGEECGIRARFARERWMVSGRWMEARWWLSGRGGGGAMVARRGLQSGSVMRVVRHWWKLSSLNLTSRIDFLGGLSLNHSLKEKHSI